MDAKSKHHILYIFCCFVFLCTQTMTSLRAQDSQDSQDALETKVIAIEEVEEDYFIEQTEEGSVFVQKLTWDEEAYVLRYDVVIETQDENGQWVALNIISTDTNFVEVSLKAGLYRYKTLVYNLFDILELESIWFEISIIQALQPTIEDFSPSLIYLDEEQTGLFRLNGENLSEETTFTLEILNLPERTLIGSLVKIDDKRVEVQFDVEAIDVGNYIFSAKNSGGLTSKIDPFVVKFLKLYDLNVVLGYSPTWTPSSGEISKYFNTEFLPFGFSARVTYIPLKKIFGHFGVEVTAYGFLMKKDLSVHDISTNSFPLTLNFVYQLPIIKKRLVLDTHAGIGFSFFNNLQFDFGNDVVSTPLNAIGTTINVGASLQFYILNRLFIEAGADYLFTTLQNAIFQMVIPSISIGWQF